MFFSQIFKTVKTSQNYQVTPQEEEFEGGSDLKVDTELAKVEPSPSDKQGSPSKVSNKSFFGSKINEKVFDANIPRLCIFTFVLGLGNIQTGFAISGNNQNAPVIKAKFGWDKEEAILYNTIISSAAVLGIVTGSLAGGNFITKGRRIAIIIFNVFSAMATALTMWLNFPAIVIGRFFYGFCCGVFSVAGPKMLDETVPIQLNSTFGTATNTFLSGGIMIAILLGVFLPDGDDFEAQQNTNYWRVIYGAPFFCQVITILMFLTCFKEDSITYSISTNNDADALTLIRKVYAAHEDPEQILESLKSKSEKGSSNITLGQACCDRKYKPSTWIAFFLCLLQQQTGLDGIMIWSNTIFTQMAENTNMTISPKAGSYLVGCMNWGGALISPIPLSYFGRKTLLFWGQICMGSSLMAAGVCYMMDMSTPVIFFMCFAIVTFQFSQAPIAWMYSAEVAVDTALGMCILALFLSLLEKSITIGFMVNSPMGPHGMFFFFGTITLLGAIFMAVYIKETKGLTDLEKKSLYFPEDIKAEMSAQRNQESAARGFELSEMKKGEMSENKPAEVVEEKPEQKSMQLDANQVAVVPPTV